MDEVEHRRRRTRGRPADSPESSLAPKPDHSPRTAVVTPADIADRAGGERTVPEQPSHQPQHPHPHAGTERPLPFEPHVAHANHSTHPGHDEREGERGLRGLVGGGSTQVSVTAAMRARDAARPSDAEMAEAEAALTIVHRGWVPREAT
jgi:hypothetical protein